MELADIACCSCILARAFGTLAGLQKAFTHLTAIVSSYRFLRQTAFPPFQHSKLQDSCIAFKLH